MKWFPERGGPKQGNMFGRFDRFLVRLESKMNDVRYDFLLKPKIRTSSASLTALLRDFVGLGTPKAAVTVVDLSCVPFDVRPTVAAQIGRLAFEFNYWNPEYREFPILLVCEEAHAYIPRDSERQFSGSRKSMERIAKEGRKYGVGPLRRQPAAARSIRDGARTVRHVHLPSHNESERSELRPELGARKRGRLGQCAGWIGTGRGARAG